MRDGFTLFPVRLIGWCFLAGFAAVATAALTPPSGSPFDYERAQESRSKRIVGATSSVVATEPDISFEARVDTGATTCSMHADACRVVNPGQSKQEDVGKTIRFRVSNRRGQSQWLQRRIEEVAAIKTSEREEIRYKVFMELSCGGVSKRVLVSLNDRSHMSYPVLLGRNFLEGDFLVDVSRKP